MQQFMERNIARNREKQEKTDSITRMLKENQILGGHGKSEKRVEARRMVREAEAEQLEIQQDRAVIQAAEMKAQKAQISAMEDNIAQELEKRNAREIRTEMNKRRICDGSDELKELKIKLQAAHMNKTRKGQLKEKELFKVEEKEFDVDIAAVMEVRRQAAIAAAEIVEEKKHENRIIAKDLNVKQITDGRKEKEAEAFRILSKDKKQVQNIVDRIAKEDLETLQIKRDKVTETKTAIKRFNIEQTQMKKEQKEREDEELRRIEQYSREKREQEERLLAEKAEVEREKKIRLKALLEQAESRNREAAELEYLRNELHQEELDALNRRREEMQLRKKLEDRVEMHKAYEQQMALKAEKRRQEAEKEEEFRQRLLEKFAEDDRIEQMNDNKRRLRIEAHKREVNRLWTVKMDMLLEEEMRDKAALDLQRSQEQERQDIISEERLRLLRELAAPIKDHLPKGVFETASDHTMIMGRPPKDDY